MEKRVGGVPTFEKKFLFISGWFRPCLKINKKKWEKFSKFSGPPSPSGKIPTFYFLFFWTLPLVQPQKCFSKPFDWVLVRKPSVLEIGANYCYALFIASVVAVVSALLWCFWFHANCKLIHCKGWLYKIHSCNIYTPENLTTENQLKIIYSWQNYLFCFP